MRVNLAIEEDEEFRQHIKDMISGVVRGILRQEMSGIIHTELAKLRLLDPNSPAMGQLINNQIEARVAEAVLREWQKVPYSTRLSNEASVRFQAVMDFLRTGKK